MERRRRRDAHADSALLAARRSLGRFNRVIKLRERCARLLEKRPASFSPFNAARLATKKLDLELMLNCFDLLAERRLLDPEPLRRP